MLYNLIYNHSPLSASMIFAHAARSGATCAKIVYLHGI